mgnify:FL=1
MTPCIQGEPPRDRPFMPTRDEYLRLIKIEECARHAARMVLMDDERLFLATGQHAISYETRKELRALAGMDWLDGATA